MTAASVGLVALVLRGTEPQPTCEVPFRGKATDVHADFGQNHQGRSHANPLDQCQVHTQRLDQWVLCLEPDVVAFVPTLARLRGPSFLSGSVREPSEFRLNLLVALGDLAVAELVQVVRLPKFK
jgi:hypothetical protein